MVSFCICQVGRYFSVIIIFCWIIFPHSQVLKCYVLSFCYIFQSTVFLGNKSSPMQNSNFLFFVCSLVTPQYGYCCLVISQSIQSQPSIILFSGISSHYFLYLCPWSRLPPTEYVFLWPTVSILLLQGHLSFFLVFKSLRAQFWSVFVQKSIRILNYSWRNPSVFLVYIHQ